MPQSRRGSISLFVADQTLLAALITLRALLRPWPLAWQIRLGGWIGRAAGRLSKRRILAVNNLKRAFGDDPAPDPARLERAADESYRDLGRSIVEFLISPRIDRAYFEKHVEVEGEERLAGLIGAGRGVVLLTGHFGNWEFLNLMAGVRRYELAVLAKAQKLRASDAYLNRLRTQNGARVILRGMDLRRVYRTLAAGGLAGILADQDGGENGVFVPLFGRAAAYPRGVARFSYVSGAPALPVFCVRVSADRHRIHIGRPIGAREGESEADHERRVVAEFSDQLEAMIRRYPSQWMWSHRRWKSSPDRDLLVLDDGRKGHLNQSVALAQKVIDRRRASPAREGRDPGVTRLRTVRIEYRSSAARAALTVWGILTRGHLWGGKAWLRWTLTGDSCARLLATPAAAVISCGTATEAVNLIVSRDCRAKSCYIQKPQFGTRRFTAVLIPEHDRPADGANLLRTGGAVSVLDQRRLAALRDRARTETGIPTGALAAALLIGGPSKHAPWDPATLEHVFFALRDLSRQHKLYLLITTSRRTDAAVESMIERIFTAQSYCPVILIAGRSNPPNAYEGMLAAADRLLVTADSVSMISEAVGSGKPVGLITPGAAIADKGKFGRFIQHLEKSGAALRLSPADLESFLTGDGPSAAGAAPGSAGPASEAAALAAERLSD